MRVFEKNDLSFDDIYIPSLSEGYKIIQKYVQDRDSEDDYARQQLSFLLDELTNYVHGYRRQSITDKTPFGCPIISNVCVNPALADLQTYEVFQYLNTEWMKLEDDSAIMLDNIGIESNDPDCASVLLEQQKMYWGILPVINDEALGKYEISLPTGADIKKIPKNDLKSSAPYWVNKTGHVSIFNKQETALCISTEDWMEANTIVSAKQEMVGIENTAKARFVLKSHGLSDKTGVEVGKTFVFNKKLWKMETPDMAFMVDVACDLDYMDFGEKLFTNVDYWCKLNGFTPCKHINFSQLHINNILLPSEIMVNDSPILRARYNNALLSDRSENYAMRDSGIYYMLDGKKRDTIEDGYSSKTWNSHQPCNLYPCYHVTNLQELGLKEGDSFFSEGLLWHVIQDKYIITFNNIHHDDWHEYGVDAQKQAYRELLEWEMERGSLEHLLLKNEAGYLKYMYPDITMDETTLGYFIDVYSGDIHISAEDGHLVINTHAVFDADIVPSGTENIHFTTSFADLEWEVSCPKTKRNCIDQLKLVSVDQILPKDCSEEFANRYFMEVAVRMMPAKEENFIKGFSLLPESSSGQDKAILSMINSALEQTNSNLTITTKNGFERKPVAFWRTGESPSYYFQTDAAFDDGRYHSAVSHVYGHEKHALLAVMDINPSETRYLTVGDKLYHGGTIWTVISPDKAVGIIKNEIDLTSGIGSYAENMNKALQEWIAEHESEPVMVQTEAYSKARMTEYELERAALEAQAAQAREQSTYNNAVHQEDSLFDTLFPKDMYSKAQWTQISLAQQHQMPIEDIFVFACIDYSPEKMRIMRECLEKGITREQTLILSSLDDDVFRLTAVAQGLFSGQSMEEIQVYASNLYDAGQVSEMVLAIDNGVPAVIVKNEMACLKSNGAVKYSASEMHDMRLNLEERIRAERLQAPETATSEIAVQDTPITPPEISDSESPLER